MPVNTRLQIRRGTYSEWVVANPVLHYGEMAWESDTGRIKIGPTGNVNWQSIPYSFATLQDPSNAGSLNSFLSESGISFTGVTGVYGHVTGIQIDSKLSPGTDIGLSTDGNGSIVISYTGDASLNFQDRAQVETIQDIVGSGDHTSTGFIRQVSGINIVYDDNGSNGSGTLTFALNELVGESGVVTSYNNDSWKIAADLTSGSGIEITDVAGSKKITATGLALESHNHNINDINGFSSVDVTDNSVSGINNLIASGTGIFDVLEINGSNGFVFPNTDGNDDQILVTDGSGVVSWQDQPVNHPVIDNALGNTSNGGRDYVQNISFDQYGHVTGISLGTETVVDHSVTGVVFNSGNNDLVLYKSDGVSITGNLSGVLVSGTSYHSNISNAANDSINNNRNYVQSILLDEYGHTTGITTATETVVDTNILTSLSGDSVNTKLVYVDESGVSNDIDLSWAMDDTNLARLVTGVIDSDGKATFVRDDGTDFDVDFGVLFDDTNLSRITSGNFDTSNGILTLTRGLDDTTVSVNFNGRYATTGELVSTSGHLQTQIDSLPDDNTFISSINYSTIERDLIVTRNDGVQLTGNFDIVIHSGDNVSLLTNDANYIDGSGYIQGTGINNFIPVFSGVDTIRDSIIHQSGNTLGINDTASGGNITLHAHNINNTGSWILNENAQGNSIYNVVFEARESGTRLGAMYSYGTAYAGGSIATVGSGGTAFTNITGPVAVGPLDANKPLIFGGGQNRYATIHASEFRINPSGLTQDFIVHGTGDHPLIYTDASTDRVGIGTNSPINQLDVVATGVHEGITIRGTNAPGLTLHDNGGLGVSYSSGGSKIVEQASSLHTGLLILDADTNNVGKGSAILFKVDNTERVRITETGRVGIGTTNPATAIHIVAPTGTEGTVLSRTLDDTSFAGHLIRDIDDRNVASFQYCNSGVSQTELRSHVLIGSRESGIPVKFYQGRDTGQVAFKENNERIIFDTSGNTTLTAASGQFVNVSGNIVRLIDGYSKLEQRSTDPTKAAYHYFYSNDLLQGGLLAYGTGYALGSIMDMPSGSLHLYSNYEALAISTVGVDKPIVFGTNANSAGGERMRIAGDGNVGIGTSSPSTKLEVANNGNTTIRANNTSNNIINILNVDSDKGYIGTITDHDLRIGTNSNGRIIISNSGNVGIGTTTPEYNLDVNGTGRFVHADGDCGLIVEDTGGSGIHIGDCAYSDGDTYAGMKHSNHTHGQEYMIISAGHSTVVSSKAGTSTYIRAGGNATTYQGIFGTSAFGIGSSGNRFRVNSQSVIVNNGTGNYDFIVKAQDEAIPLIHADGATNKVGIGTDTPAYKLDVSGTFSADSINVNNQYTLPTGDGLTGHSLVTDGAGNIIFSGVSAAGGGGSVNTIYSNGVQVGDDDIEILDFSSNFSVSENPNAKINIDLADMITVSGITISGLNPSGYTLPASDGFNRQVLATDGSGIVYWSGISDIMSGFSDYEIVTSTKSSFIVNGGFTVGSLDVYYNGLKLLNGDDYVEVDGTGFTLSSAATLNDVIEWEGHKTAPEYVTLGNPGSNRLVTSDGSSTTINGQSDLIFDGSGLGLGTTSPSPSGGENSLHIHSNIYPEIKLTNTDTNTTSSDGTSILVDEDKNLRIVNFEQSLTKLYNTKSNGSVLETLRLGSTQSLFNPAGDENLDFLVSGSGSSNLIFADSSTNRVGIGNNSPTTKLDVSGVITASGGDSTQWNISYSTLTGSSGNWNDAHALVGSTGNWNTAYVWVTGNSGNLVYTNQTYENPSWLTSVNANIISGVIPESNLPSYVDDVLEYASTGNFPGSAASGIIYVALDTNKVYRWSGSTYIEISSDTNNFVDGVSFNPVNGDLTLSRLGIASISGNLDGRYARGNGTTNYLAKWTSSKNISSGIIYDDGTNIGIGTASPNYKLDVAGSGSFNALNINDAFTFPTSDGTEGQSLVTDGAGTVVWSGIDTDTNNYVTGVAFDAATEVLTLNRLDLSDLTTSSFSGVYLKELSQDPSPQLGGNLDLNSRDITGNGNIDINGYLTITGDLTADGNNVDIGSAAYGLQVSSSAATLGNNRLQLLSSETVFNQAGANYDFRVEGTGQSHLLFIDSSKDSVGIATEYPTSKLTIGSGYLDGGGICVDMEGVNKPSFTARRENGDPVFSILPYTSQVYMSVGVYYNGSSWVHSSDNSNSSIFAIDPPNGVLWYSSNSPSSISNVANGVNLWDAQGRWNADVIGSVTGPVSGIVAPSGAYTLPSVDGAYGQVLVTSGDGTVNWQDQTGTGGGGTSNLIRQSYTPTTSTSSFTVTNGYTVGSINVYKNGVKLFEDHDGQTYDYSATNGTVFNLTSAAASGDLIEVVALNANAAPTANTALASVGVTSTQSQFNTSETITSSSLVVFLNGVKLVDSIDYSVITASRFDLLSPATSGDTVDYIVYGATVASSNLQKTGDTMTGNLTVGADLIVTGYKETHTDNGNTGTVRTIDITDSTIQTYTLNGNCVFTMPTPDAGRSFTVLLKTGAGSFTGTFTGVKFPGNVAPTITASGNRLDTLTFISDGTNWYGNAVQDYHL